MKTLSIFGILVGLTRYIRIVFLTQMMFLDLNHHLLQAHRQLIKITLLMYMYIFSRQGNFKFGLAFFKRCLLFYPLLTFSFVFAFVFVFLLTSQLSEIDIQLT
jgi:hypothetical protein